MTRTVDELVAIIASDPTLPWSDNQVRRQSEPLSADLWRRHLPRGVADRLDLESWPASVTRQDLFELAAGIQTPDGALAVYAYIAGWGAGRKARPVWRASRAFVDDRLGERLLAARQHLATAGAVDAYWWMLPGGAHHVHHLGPAFLSKWLYFCDYPADPTRRLERTPALILDQRVQRALQLPTITSHHHYATYLQLAETVAERLNTTPHVIEHALFAIGGPRQAA